MIPYPAQAVTFKAPCPRCGRPCTWTASPLAYDENGREEHATTTDGGNCPCGEEAAA